MLGADVVVVEHPSLFLGKDNHPPRAVGEPLEHCDPPQLEDWYRPKGSNKLYVFIVISPGRRW
ncbi:hypothetical protein Lesp01_39310 [Lentzea sp. NBRC 102530]|nr:hypothetical protein Lesp01_39310 [Lentzea sp. NBRC 102530]